MKPVELEDLKRLLDFGAECFEHQKVDILKLRGAKKVLFPMLMAAHNYTEGVWVLCRENRSHPCFTLLRSLCDNLINAKFLYCSPKKHSHIIFLDAVIEKRKQLNHALEYLQQNPERLSETRVTIKDVAKSLQDVMAQEKNTRTKIDNYPGDLISGSLKRTRHVDGHNKKRKSRTNSLEWFYIQIFRTLSSSTHVNFLDFPSYFKQEEKEIVVFLSGNPDDIGAVLSLADYLYKEVLNMFLRVFKSPLKKQFNEICKTQGK